MHSCSFGKCDILIPTVTVTFFQKIEINKDDSVVLRVEEGPKVYFNDKLQLLDVKHSVMVVRDKQGRVVMHVVYTPDSSLRIQLPYDHLSLRYTDSSLVVRVRINVLCFT